MNKRQLAGACSRCGTPVTVGSRTGLCRGCYDNLKRTTGRKVPPTAAELASMAKAEMMAAGERFARAAGYARDYSVETPELSGDWVVVSDVHVPRHSERTCCAVVAAGQRYDVRQLLVAGDLMDFEEISAHRHMGTEGVSAVQSLLLAFEVLQGFAVQFDRIVVIKGNHDDRLQRLIEAAVEGRSRAQAILDSIERQDVVDLSHRERYVEVLRRQLERHAPDLAGRVEWMGCPSVVLDLGGGEKLRVTHPAIYHRKAPEAERRLAVKYEQSILGTHGHVWGASIAPNGRHLVAQFGCATDDWKHGYLFEKETDHPRWCRGFAVVQDGRVRLIADNPFWADNFDSLGV